MSPESSVDQLYRLRHSLAHILAQAVLQIRPQAQLGFGPPVDTGFYYDFDFGDEPVTADDLKDLTKRM
ncbi:MAG: threonine--tRNA ligase, partial [Lentisphaeria bacterium]|nr:threonine--tRNA ligase [Lentisphaeria bacterium]